MTDTPERERRLGDTPRDLEPEEYEVDELAEDVEPSEVTNEEQPDQGDSQDVEE